MTEASIMSVTFAELCLSIDASDELVLELLEYRIVQPLSGQFKNEWLFSVTAVSAAKKALRLQRDLAMELADIALMLNLLEENEKLLAENQSLKQRLNRFVKEEGEG